METTNKDLGQGSPTGARGETGALDGGYGGGSYGRSTRVQGSTEATAGEEEQASLADRAKDALGKTRDVVAERLGPVGEFAKKNPWIAVGAAVGAGLLVAGIAKSRGGAKARIAKMNEDQPVGRSRGWWGRTDEVAEKMSEASDAGIGPGGQGAGYGGQTRPMWGWTPGRERSE
jgi:hypothetical protein